MYFLSRCFTLFLVPFLLASCLWIGGTSSPDSVDNSGLVKYTGTGYALRVPASWEKVESSKISAPVTGKIEVAMRSPVNKKGFMNNLVILSDTIATPATSSEYVSQSMSWAAKEYLTLAIDSDEQVVFADDSTSRLIIFRAKYNEVTEEHLFMQTARICGSTVYLITLGLERETWSESYDRYRPIFRSFTCQ
jgi:hypothetical protein